MAIAIDSNVVLYAFDSDAGEKHRIAGKILGGGGEAGLCVPLQVLGEIFAVLTKRRRWSALQARAVVTTLISTLPICLPSATSLDRATDLCRRHTVGFWDAQIVNAAAEYGCNLLFSEDFQDGRRFTAADAGRPVRIINPFNETHRDLLTIFALTRLAGARRAAQLMCVTGRG